jgi:GGDEF domain-containing protein
VPVVSLSIGVVVADPRQCSPEDLLRRSDLAMYRHKQERASARRTG